MMVGLLKRLAREPLVHFFALAALLFVGYDLLNRDEALAPGRIVISQGQLASMMEGFVKTRQRPPTSAEWDGLIRARVKEEVFYREALALGMDKGDSIIRRRLQQKMEFVSDDLAVYAPPTDAELNAYLRAHPGQFRTEPKLDFRQVYLDLDKRGANLTRDATQLMAKLNQGDAGWSTMGDPFAMPHEFTAVPSSEVARQFGAPFAAALDKLQPGRWQGPIESAFGAHLIFISQRAPAQPPVLADVRDAVSREWNDDRRREANEQFYQALLKRYRVTIEAPGPAAEGKRAPGVP